MHPNHQLLKLIKSFYQKNHKQSTSKIREQRSWLLRTFLVTRKQADWVNAGFVLPTVAMVTLVVILLTTAILFRSFKRAENASNVRVNQAVLNAANPALERAKAKIDKLFEDPRLPRSTPNDVSLYDVISTSINEFTFGDETPLNLFYDIDGNGSRKTNPSSLYDDENLNTAWKYPVDTDNNGKFDSYTLYAIYFRNPPNSNNARARNPLEARTPPMNESQGGEQCDRGNNTSAQLVGNKGWYKRGSTLKRSIFVYTLNLPITNTTGLSNKYETFNGNKGFIALEYQQDRERSPLTNNAVLYNDDLEIAPGGGLRLNGRIATNSNLLTGQRIFSNFQAPMQFYLVSSPSSCYYNVANSKILVGGNVANARIRDTSDMNNSKQGVIIDLFTEAGVGNQPKINSQNKTTTSNGGTQVAYNSRAYETRIQLLVEAAMERSTLPTEVTEEVTRQTSADSSLDANKVKEEVLKTYFRKRTRRVPYAEVAAIATSSDILGSYTKSDVLQITNNNVDSMRPPDAWAFPFDPSDGTDHVGYANLPLKTNTDNSNKITLAAKETDLSEPEGDETYIGDRILVGNNLPQVWWDSTQGKFVSGNDAGQNIKDKEWDQGSGTRKRYPQIRQLDDLGATGRDQFWEQKAAEYPSEKLDVVGGLRVVTGAGIYLPNGLTTTSSFTSSNSDSVVWSDQMPVATTPNEGLPSTKTPYLQMRATAVYHFQNNTYNPGSTNPQTPIACVSSYYDPTNATTAKNKSTLPWNGATGGQSNNGIVYNAPSRTKANYTNALNYQATLRYPNGRLVNEQLKNALDKGSGNLTLSEKSALDSAICALQILDNSLTRSTTKIPNGAIYETAFLDARQVKTVDKPNSPGNYDLDVELRQPLEIRTTVLDMNLLRGQSAGSTTHSTTEYLIPNSGIIYATRDDTLPDLSDSTTDISATDFVSDPTRRPNGIMTINGEDLSRTSNNRAEEKGLILVSNLPVYIKGDFNRHTYEEYKTGLADDWSNFYNRTADNFEPKFACRQGQFTDCDTGESWRAATVIADAITVLSNNFREGFRNEGDYDLRDNIGNTPLGHAYDYNNDGDTNDTVNLDETLLKFDINGDGDQADRSVSIAEQNIPGTVLARINGFWDNNFVTSFPWQDNSGAQSTSGYGFPATLDSTPQLILSSYFNNFVTPVQRRLSFTEYVMEICRKATIAACKPNDWVVGYDANGDGDFSDSGDDINLKASDLQTNNSSYTVKTLGAGTTARPAIREENQRYPRRVAFVRDASGNLVLDSNNRPIPIGVAKNRDNPTALSSDDNNGQISYYPSASTTINSTSYSAYSSSNRPRRHNRALWFKTNKSGNVNFGYDYPLWVENSSSLSDARNTDQPLLAPVLQIHFPRRTSGGDLDNNSTLWQRETDISNFDNNWLQVATDTETNLVIAQGDTPGRPTESNGGLENFVRYLETWKSKKHVVKGSFIQYKRSSYGVAPWQVFVANYQGDQLAFSDRGTIFGYPQGYRIAVTNEGTWGRSPFYFPPARAWGFDVALLTQLPDLFSQRFTAPPTGDPNEFYREVGRDDDWVETLLCASQNNSNTFSGGHGEAPENKYGSSQEYAIAQDQRPSQCR